MPTYRIVEQGTYYRTSIYLVDADTEDEAFELVVSENAGPAEEIGEYEWEFAEITEIKLQENENEG